jgi:hypothetical protein
MARFYFLVLCLVITAGAHAQKKDVTFYKDIQPIVLQHCAPCHSPGQAAPFTLHSYDDVASRGDFIVRVTSTGYMPPWKPDPGFQRYKNERILSDSAKELIQVWVKNGMPKGKRTKQQETVEPVSVEKPDLSVSMTPYKIPTNSVDDYRFFNIPTTTTQDHYLTKIEFIPGNKKLVHHSRLMTDTSHMVREINGMSANDARISEFGKYPPQDFFLYGWVPGNFAINFPKGTGKKLLRDSDIIMNVHYSPNARPDQTDQSTVNFYFSKEPVEREVYSLAIAEESIVNPPFLIRANETAKFMAQFGPLPIDISAIAINPHMHYLGKTIRAFAATPEGEAIFLVQINNWDFKWQDTYQFEKLLKIPKGSMIFLEATYDNTTANPANPSNPPKDVTYGWATKSEMMSLVLYYVEYKKGDEDRRQ